MSQKTQERTENMSHDKEERRQFMKTAAKLAGVMAALGIAGDSLSVIGSSAQENRQPSTGGRQPGGKDYKIKGLQPKTINLNPQQQALGNLLLLAIERKDMDEAIRETGANDVLDHSQLSALRQLNRADLEALNKIQSKLKSSDLGTVSDVVGVTIF